MVSEKGGDVMAQRPSLRTMRDNLAPAARGTRVSFQEAAATASALGETQLSDTGPFDAVLLAGPEGSTRLGGMSLLERAAFTMAGAGAGRILCVGEHPAAALRLPAVDVTWTLG